MIQAVIFDFDGTLADTEPYHTAVREQMLKELNVAENGKFVGISLRAFWDRVVKNNNLSVDGKTLAKRTFDEVCRAVRAAGIKPNEGAVEMLEELKKLGYALALASSSDRDYVEELLSYFRLDKYFSYTVCGDEVVNLKPAPDIYGKAVELCNLNVQAVVAVEDSDAGMQSAKTAGLKCIGFKAENAAIKQSFSYSDIIVKNLREIPAAIDKLQKGDNK